jgi:uncharacterized protein
MKVAGSHRLASSRQQVWDALQDPAVLARTLPGCESLEVTGPGSYLATLTAGVASVKGTYRGKVALSEQVEPASYRLAAEGAGAPGTVRADAHVRLEVDGDGTLVTYEADAVIGGMIGGVGQRMLVGVAKKTAGEFFSAIEYDLAGAPVVAGELVADLPPGGLPVPGEPVGVGVTVEDRAEMRVGQTFSASASRPGRPTAETRSQDLLLAGVVGAVIALAGVLVGRRLSHVDHGASR